MKTLLKSALLGLCFSFSSLSFAAQPLAAPSPATPSPATPSPAKEVTPEAQLIRSVLVLPAINNTNEPLAEYSWLATVSRPLAEAGYYVFPVVIIDAFMKENGLPSGNEMHDIPLQKISEIIGADAVLYVEINEYGQQYQIVNSKTVFSAQARLVDVKTGDMLWSGQAHESKSSNGGDHSVSGMLVNALLTQVMESGSDNAHELTRVANNKMFLHRGGLPKGPRYLTDAQLEAVKAR